MEKIKVLIVEKSLNPNENLKALVEDIGYEVLDCMLYGDEVVKTLYQSNPDLVLMSIEDRRDTECFGLIQSCAELKIPFFFIFTSFGKRKKNLAEYIPLAFIAKPMDGKVLSSFSYSSLKALSDKGVMDANESQAEKDFVLKNCYFVKKNNVLQKVYFKDILFIHSMGNYVTIQTTRDKYVLRKALSQLEKQFPREKFIRVHKSYMIRLEALEVLDKGESELLINGHRIPIGRKYKEPFLEKLPLLN